MEERQRYPLEQLATIKQKRLEEAEKVLQEKKQALEKEQDKLSALEKERDEVKAHKIAKLTQLREKMDEGVSAPKIQQMKQYLKTVDEKLKIHDHKVQEQEKVVTSAEKQVEAAREDLFKKQKDVEKLKIHREEWDLEMGKIREQKEAAEGDEMGGAMHIIKKRAKKHKKHHNHG